MGLRPFAFVTNYMSKRNYERTLLKLKQKKSPIKVIFLSLENQKWSYDSLYKIFEQSDRFEPLILVSIHKDIPAGKLDVDKKIADDNYNFYKLRGYNVQYLYKDGRYLDLKSFEPDIVFYEQPWGWVNSCRPSAVSKYALTMYLPYGFSMLNYIGDYKPNFHKDLFAYFVHNDDSIKRFEDYKKGNSKNCVAVGYSKLDTYLDKKEIDSAKYWKNSEKFKIIYAPHHTFKDDTLRMATFLKTGEKILELAKSHSETTWIFKPHPRFDVALREIGFSQEKIENYYKEWQNIGNVYTDGDYFDIFKSSDLMITDCCSFLGEYFPTGKPLIRPVNENSRGLNHTGQQIVSGYYEVKENNELEEVFETLVVKRIDSKRQIREAVSSVVIDFNEKVADKIFKYINLIIN